MTAYGHRIASIPAVFNNGKAIRSEDQHGEVIWFYRQDQEYLVLKDGETHQIDQKTIEANIHHQQTAVETVPVDESPFSDIEEASND